jgi:ubiquinone/menaquinone biosynthesis C-methylase UbiE
MSFSGQIEGEPVTEATRPPRRLIPWARRLAKRGLVQWDLLRNRKDPAVQKWKSVLAGAYAGHIVIPSKAISSSREEAADFADHGLVHSGDRVLDVGGGNGRQAIGLLELGVAEYVGLDVVKGSVAWANGAFGRIGATVHFDLLDVANAMYNPGGSMQPEEAVFPYPDNSFDFAVAGSLYTHLERIEVARRYVAETARILRPGGGAYMSFFRSPPNSTTASAVRTVYLEGDIRDAVKSYFVVERESGGNTTSLHDQWRLYLRKPSS